jgi:hypothetical protein
MFKTPTHRNNKLRNLLLSSAIVNYVSSKQRAFLSLHIVHIKAQRGHSPHLHHHFIASLTFPACHEIKNPTIHYPLHTKKSKEHTPKSTSHLTMKEKMIDGLTTPLAHTTPIHHNQTFLVKIIQSENLAKRSRPHEETNSERDFNLPNALPQERRMPHLVPIRRKGKHTEERAHHKKLPLGRNPTNPIHPPPPPT